MAQAMDGLDHAHAGSKHADHCHGCVNELLPPRSARSVDQCNNEVMQSIVKTGQRGGGIWINSRGLLYRRNEKTRKYEEKRVYQIWRKGWRTQYWFFTSERNWWRVVEKRVSNPGRVTWNKESEVDGCHHSSNQVRKIGVRELTWIEGVVLPRGSEKWPKVMSNRTSRDPFLMSRSTEMKYYLSDID